MKATSNSLVQSLCTSHSGTHLMLTLYAPLCKITVLKASSHVTIRTHADTVHLLDAFVILCRRGSATSVLYLLRGMQHCGLSWTARCCDVITSGTGSLSRRPQCPTLHASTSLSIPKISPPTTQTQSTATHSTLGTANTTAVPVAAVVAAAAAAGTTPFLALRRRHTVEEQCHPPQAS